LSKDPQTYHEENPAGEVPSGPRHRRWPWIAAVLLLVLGSLLLWAVQSDPVLDRIRGEVERIANEQLNGTLKVESLTGNLFHTLTLTGISVLEDDGTPLFNTDTLHVRYRLLPLFQGRVAIDEFRLHAPDVYLRQTGSDSWNVLDLLPQSADTTSTAPDLQVALDHIRINDGAVRMVAPGLLPDNEISVDSLMLDASFALLEDGFSARLRGLDLNIREGRLPGPIAVHLAGAAEDNRYTLDRLTVATGRSLLQASARYVAADPAADSAIDPAMDTAADPAAGDAFAAGDVRAEADAGPLSWRDVQSYTEDPFFVQDVEIGLEITGSLSDLRARLDLNAVGIDGFQIAARASLADTLRLTEFNLEAARLDAPRFTGQAASPILSGLRLEFRGEALPSSLHASTGEATLRLDSLRFEDYRLDAVALEAGLRAGDASADLSASLEGEWIRAQATAGQVFASDPAWQLDITTSSLDAARWLADDALAYTGTLELDARGTGWEPGDTPWQAELRATDIMVGAQPIDSVRVNLRASSEELELVSRTSVNQSVLNVNVAARQWNSAERPGYSFLVETSGFDLSDLTGYDNFPTSINLLALGTGSGIRPETMQVTSSLEIDSSSINTARIDRFQANLRLQDEIVYLTDTFLQSSFATGQLNVRRHINDIFSPDNRVDFNLEVGELNPLAPLAGLSRLEASGRATGTLMPDADGVQVVDATLRLRNLRADSLQAGRVEGRAGLRLSPESTYEMDLRFSDVATTGYHLDTVLLATNGTAVDGQLDGSCRIVVDFTENTRFVTRADYRGGKVEEELDLYIQTYQFQLSDDRYQYNLEQPFVTTVREGLLQMEPLILTGRDSRARLSLEVDQYAASGFTGSVEASEINLAILQRIAMDEALFDGMMEGYLRFDADLDAYRYDVESGFDITDVRKDSLVLDRVEGDFRLRDGRMKAVVSTTEGGLLLAALELDVPFEPGDHQNHTEAFFDGSVYGRLETRSINLEQEPALAELLGLQGVTGEVALAGNASGTAGEPQLELGLRMNNARVSGVAIDSLSLAAAYLHEDARFTLESSVTSGGQTAAEVSGYIPFQIDMRTFEVSLPDQENPIAVTVQSDAFDIAAFNQFADPALTRNITGLIDADLRIGGTFTEPQLEGELALDKASVFLTPNNITIRDVSARLGFTPDAITIEQLTATSSGTIEGSGRVRLDGFVPREAELSLNARSFRAYNTRDIQAFLSMDISLSGAVTNPVLNGNLRLERGYFYMDNFGERSVEDVQLEEEEEPSMLAELDLWNNLEMEVNFVTDRNFFVRNRSMPEVELELQGELDVVKPPGEEVQVFGTMGARQGYVTQLGKRFDLEEAEVQFSGTPENPALQVRTLYELRQPSDVRIWYVIGGTVDEPTFTYESDPEMETGDIISYTLFGRPLNALAGWQQSVAGRSEGGVGDAAVDILLDRVEQLAAQALGIDVLTIDNSRTAGQSGTTIKAGKYISDRMFVALIQELGTDISSQVLLEYQIRRNLDVIITGSDNNRNGLEIQWELDY